MRESVPEGWRAKFSRYNIDVQALFRTVPKRERFCCKGEDAKPLSLPAVPFPKQPRQLLPFIQNAAPRLPQICAGWPAERPIKQE